jgi:hypothetical protein
MLTDDQRTSRLAGFPAAEPSSFDPSKRITVVAYQCPRCGGPLQQASSAAAGAAGGAVGALLASAFGSFHCPQCGPIARREFPPDVQRRMMLGSVTLVLVAVGLLIALIVVLILIRTW